MESTKTYDSDDSDHYRKFIEILENDDDIFMAVFLDKGFIRDDAGPYIRFKFTRVLKDKMDKLVSNMQTDRGHRYNLFKVINNTFSRMLNSISGTLYEYANMVNVKENIDIYFNSDSGLQVCLEYYVVVSEKVINEIVENAKYNKKMVEKTVETTPEAGTLINELASYVWSYLY